MIKAMKHRVTFAGYILAVVFCLISCKSVTKNEVSFAEGNIPDGTYVAEWQHKGTWYSCRFELYQEALKSAVFIDVDKSEQKLKAKLSHHEFIKALIPDVDESEFYFQFSLFSKEGYMTKKQIREDISVILYKE